MKSYKELIVWQRAMELVELVYTLTNNFPKQEMYGLTSQIRRSAVSIPSNIAEGKFRHSTKDFKRFLQIAFASGAELETQIELSKRMEYINEEEFRDIQLVLNEVMKMLNALLTKFSNIANLAN